MKKATTTVKITGHQKLLTYTSARNTQPSGDNHATASFPTSPIARSRNKAPNNAKENPIVPRELSDNCANTPVIPAKINPTAPRTAPYNNRSEEHTSELQSRGHPVCRRLLGIQQA